MKLYYSKGACSLAVHIALHEVGIPFDIKAVNLAAHQTEDGGNYYDISPRGYVPLLELDDGSRHTEVAALLQYVADLDPQQALIGPIKSLRRLKVTEWLAFASTELHKTFGPLWQKDTPDSVKEGNKKKLAKRFAEMNELLSKQDFLVESFSVADAYVFTVVGWTRVLGISLSEYPRLEAYLARVAARPQVEKALRAEGLLA